MDHGEIEAALKAYADADREGALMSDAARLRYAGLLSRQRRPADAVHQYQAVLASQSTPADAAWAPLDWPEWKGSLEWRRTWRHGFRISDATWMIPGWPG